MENHGMKRSASDSQNVLHGVTTVVVDIEGTTTPISFVKDELFPYVKDNVKAFFESHWEEEECQADVEALRQQASEDKDAEGFVAIPDKEQNQEAQIEGLVGNVCWQMEQDRKTTALKQLQGHVWREAYNAGKIKGSVYGDVVTALKEWACQDRKVYVYSSGSVEAQKLLFGCSDQGDLQQYVSGYFDTNVGEKASKDSYSKIAEQVGSKPEEMLFLTDVSSEAAAASDAGYKTCLVMREGNAPLTDEDKARFNMVESFSELGGGETQEDVPAKRQEVEQDGDAEEAAAEAEEAAAEAEAEEEAEIIDDEGDEIDDDDLDDEDIDGEEGEEEDVGVEEEAVGGDEGGEEAPEAS